MSNVSLLRGPRRMGEVYAVSPSSKLLSDRRVRWWSLAGALLAWLGLGWSAPVSAAPPENFAVEDVLMNIEQPLSMRFLPDGRLLVVQKKGTIRIVDTKTLPAASAVYLNLAATTHPHGIMADQERGLLDIAIDPNFPAQPYIYLFYTPKTGPNGQRARIARFTHQENDGALASRADPGSEVILWQDTDGYDSCCHFGGGLDFGPDGKLWLTVGDHFQGSYAASLEHAGGGVIRINKDGSIPADNPWVDGAGPNHDALFAKGLRNPFRARWDFPSGRFYIAEVGGNEQNKAWEDLHVLEYDAATGRFIDADFGTTSDNNKFDGLNFGWPTVEGLPPHTDFPGAVIEPIAEPIFGYRHASVRTAGDTAAINGGVVYRKTRFPSEYRGAYFYADSTRDFIRYLKFDENGAVIPNPSPAPLTLTNPDPISYPFDLTPLGRIVSLEVGPDGALYYLSFTENVTDDYGVPNPTVLGALRRYVYDAGNVRPIIEQFTATPTTGNSPLPVEFRFSASDPDNDPLRYVVDFGDSTTTGAPQPLLSNTTTVVPHTYSTDGIYQARVDISDGTSVTSSTRSVSVGTAPQISSITAVNGRAGGSTTSFRFGDTFTFSATATDAEDGPLTGAAFTWTVDFVRPGNVHPAFGPETNATSISFPIPAQGQGFSGPVFYRVSLTVTDSSGLSSTTTHDIHPEKSNLTLKTTPDKIVVQVDGNTARAATFVLDTLINLNHTLSVPEAVCIAGNEYAFSKWSNGVTTAQQTITVPASDTTLTASYVLVGPCATPPENGLVMHLSADSGVILDNNSVAVWEDQSPSGNHLSAVGTPTFVEGSMNGQSYVHFDGISDALARTGTTGLPTGAGARSVFMFVRYNAVNTSTGGWAGFAFGTAASNQTFGLTLTPAGTLGVQGWGRGNDITANPATNVVGQWVSHGAVFTGSSLTQFLNGAAAGTVSRTYATGTGGIRLGEEINGGKNLNMDVAEILVYNRVLTPQEREVVQEYFTVKYINGGVPNTAPELTIGAPAPNASFTTAQMPISLNGTASDEQDGNISSQIRWRSDRDGQLGTGASVTANLSVGTHVITATAIDSGELEDAASVTITVTSAGGAGGTLLTEGLVLHLESDLNVATNSGAGVSGWLDQSGLGNDLVAGGSPQLVSAGTPSGQPAIRLDQTDRLERVHSTDPLGGLPTGNGNRTMILVAKYNTTTWWGGVAYGTASSNRAFGLGVKHPSGELVLQGYGGANDLVSSATGLGANWLVQTGVLNNSIGTLFKNGTQVAQFNHSYATSLTRLVIGQEIGNAGYIGMDVAAVLIYNRALSAAERAQVEAYLSGKYISPATPNAPPTVSITSPANGTSFASGAAVTFTGTANDAESGNLSSQIQWSSSVNGAIGAGATVSTSSLSAGTHTITAAVTDGANQTRTATLLITIAAPNAPPTVTISAPANGSSFAAGAPVQFTASANDPENGNLSSQITWSSNVSGAIGTGATVSTSTLSPGVHTISASVTDSGGLPASATVQVTITSANARPSVAISAPVNNASFQSGSGVTFTATATDAEDGNLTAGLVWRSDRDGEIGTGGTFAKSNLSVGTHVITATAKDSQQFEGSAQVTLVITSVTPSNELPVTNGLVLHLDAAQGVTTVGGAVSLWADRSANGNHVTGAGGPLLVASATPTGRPAVRLDGVNDMLDRVHASQPLTGLPTGNGNRTMIVVAKYNTTTWWGGVAYGTASSNRAFGLGVKHPSGELYLQGYGSGNDLVSTTMGKGAGWLVQTGLLSSSVATLYSNGAQLAQFNHAFNTSLTRLVIGREIGNAGYVGVDVAAVLIYNRALSAAERTQVEAYLAQTYITAGTVPNAAPSVTISAPVNGASFAAGAAVQFTGSASDPESGNLSPQIAWSSSLNGPLGSGASVSSSTLSPGTHTVTASVSDGAGQSSSATIQVTITSTNVAPSVSISAPVNNASFQSGSSVAFTATATDPEDGNVTTALIWRSSRDGQIGTGGTFAKTNLSVGTHVITASAKDSKQAEGTAQVTVVITAATPSNNLPVTGGLVLHLDAAQGVTTSGDAVTLWSDQTPSGNHVTGTGGPLLVAGATPTGQPAVRLDGVNDLLERVHATQPLGNLPTANGNRTMIVVAKYNSTTWWGGVSYGAASSNRAFGLGVKHPTGELFLQGYGSANDLVSSAAGKGAGWLVQSGVLNNSVATLFKNGAQVGQSNHAFNTSLTRLVIGREIGNAGYIGMDVAAIVIYNRALTAAERTQVEAYLASRYITP